MNYAAVLGIASSILIAVMGGAWLLSGRMSRVESKLEDLPEKLAGRMHAIAREEIAEHRDDCPARREYITDVRRVAP